MLNIYEIIESLGLEQAKEDKLQTYLIKNQKEREELYSALISRKTNESKLSLLKCFLDNMSDYNRRLEVRIEKIENKMKEASSIVFSGIDDDTMQQMRDHLNLIFTVINWQMRIPNVSQGFSKFTWNKHTEDAQADEYLKHLKANITLPDKLEWYNAKKKRNFLNLKNQKWLPFNLKGTTDVAILGKGYLERYGQEVCGCKILIELKKPSNINSQSRFQTQGELISANHWSIYNVLAILTDLNDYWEFFWEFGNEIRSYKPTSHQDALQMLQIYVDNVNTESEEESGNGLEYTLNEELPFSKRRKLNTSNVQVSGVADFGEFTDEMSNIEIKSKQIERYLREVFIHSTSYEQFEMNDGAYSYIA
ncbi:hypothetical protein C1645_733949 [Glomus cerebriforme]|uniref:Uncharacterized protein n=1 Tax=Glomus cerebriforme TaxID=658196 RepID=A0A397TL52_9GLOM|nr:hypothetical protein C1645_733949 [Glomus cerebriforme]